MPDRVKEKLVELLRNMPIPEIIVFGQRCGKALVTVEFIANHLIANGVTVQGDKDINVLSKWISVKDRLPEDEKKVLCVLDDGFFCILEWKSWDWLWNDEYSNVYQEKDVTHWMPLPQPPKGE